MTNEQTLVDYLEGYADEARRLTSFSGSMTLAQIQTALESVTPGGGTNYEGDLIDGSYSGAYANSDATSVLAYKFYYYPSTLTGVSLPNATSIGNYAFGHCSGITSLSLPSATTIGGRAFQYCSGLTSLSLPNVTTIASNGFEQCSGLISVSLPALQTTGSNIFYYCTSLQWAELNTVQKLEQFDFGNCSALQWVSFDDVTAVPTKAVNTFGNCRNLQALYFPADLVEAAKTSWSSQADIIKPLSEKPSV